MTLVTLINTDEQKWPPTGGCLSQSGVNPSRRREHKGVKGAIIKVRGGDALSLGVSKIWRGRLLPPGLFYQSCSPTINPRNNNTIPRLVGRGGNTSSNAENCSVESISRRFCPSPKNMHCPPFSQWFGGVPHILSSLKYITELSYSTTAKHGIEAQGYFCFRRFGTNSSSPFSSMLRLNRFACHDLLGTVKHSNGYSFTRK